nr:unnamed protein product [Digitaria exilis]
MWGATRARTPRRRRACGPVLPDELVVWEILVHLPAKALLRCRAVCRSWRRLTSAADFVLAHHRLQPSLPLVFLQGTIRDSRGGAAIGATLDAFDLSTSPFTATDERRRPTLRFKDYKHHRELKVYATCDGLLLFSLWCRSKSFYICNPATRQWIELPMSLAGARIAALYRHISSGEYRILCRKGAAYPGVDAAAYYILTVGSDAEPRRVVEQPAASESIKHCMAAVLRFDHVSSYR